MPRFVKKLAKLFSVLSLTGVVALLSAGVASATPGDLDMSFGTNGVATVNNIAVFYSVVVQADGKIVAAGSGGCSPVTCGSSLPFLVRFNPDGSLDNTFGVGGITAVADHDVRTKLPLATQSDGKLLTGLPFLTRFSSEGVFETDFARNAPSGESPSTAIAVQNDGKILFALDGLLQRYNADGTYDTSFGNNGIVATSPYKSLTLYSDGKISGVSCQIGGSIVGRHNPDGSFDTGFDENGSLFIPYDNPQGSCSVNAQLDGKVIVTNTRDVQTSPHIEIRRFNADGTVDFGFGLAGMVATPGSAEASALQNDGKILVVGKSSEDIFLARFLADGNADTQFGNNGEVLTGGDQISAFAHGMTLQPDGKIIVAGQWSDGVAQTGGAALLRYDSPAAVPTPAGSNINVAFPSGISVTFAEVTNAGFTSVGTSANGPTPPAGFQLGSGALYYDIQTTATYTAPITLCFQYDTIAFPDPNLAQLFHYENGAWVDITTSNDTTNLVICGTSTSLSPFAVFKKQSDPAAFIQNLKAQVTGLQLKQGLTKELVAKLEAAQKALESGNPTKACKRMASFIKEVQAKTGKGITAAQAEQLVAGANQVRSVLGCQ